MRFPNASDEPTFSVLGDKRVPEDVAGSALAWCPTMDLVAVATTTHKVGGVLFRPALGLACSLFLHVLSLTPA